MQSLKCYIISSIICLGFTLSFAQTSSSLKSKRKKIEKQISVTNSLIKKSQQEQKNKLEELKLLNSSIELQKEHVKTIEGQVSALDYQIAGSNDSILKLKNQINILKEEYLKLVQIAYKNRSETDKLLFVFSSKNFNQAYNRVKYFEESAEVRRKYVESIKLKEQELLGFVEVLDNQKTEHTELLIDQRNAGEQLEKDKLSREETVSQLQKEEAKLKSDLKKHKEQRAKLNKAIEDAIRKELAKAKKKTGDKYELTPEMKLISSDFEANKGKLPWPVERGVITGSFGKHPHPVLAGVVEENNGVDISTSKGAEVRSLFKGKVTAVIVVSGSGKSVIVSHGAYRTVYSNLKDVYVQKGDELKTKETIGTLLSDVESGKTISHIEIWKISSTGMSKQDPALWIYRK